MTASQPIAPAHRQAAQAEAADANARSRALAERRRELTEAELARQDAARARSAEQIAEIREAISRVTGANTRLSIMRAEASSNFVYRAIDIDTGEVVHEWPHDTFLDLVRGVREDVRADVGAGLMLDEVA